jgi:hypothetical protein
MALGDFIGGPQQYDPAMALMLIQNPELVAAHLAARGHEPPEDIPQGVTHQDAGQSLGRALQFAGGGFDQSTKGDYLPPGFQSPALGFVGTFDKPAELPPIIQPPDVPQQNPASPPTPATESPQATGPVPPPSNQETPTESPKRAHITVHPLTPTDDTTDPQLANLPLPTPDPRRVQDDTGGAGGDTSGATKGPNYKGLDNFATALAGLHPLPYQNPLHIYTPQAPHPSNVISRSQVPTALMQELAAAGHPTATYRLGEALRGKAYA